MKRKGSRRTTSRKSKGAIFKRTSSDIQFDFLEEPFDDLPFEEPCVLGIVLMDGKYEFEEVLQLAPAWRMKSVRRDDGKGSTDYYFIDKKHFDAAELRALQRFEV